MCILLLLEEVVNRCQLYVNYSQLMDGAFEYNYVLTNSLPTGSVHFVKGVLNSPTVIAASSYFFL